MALKKNYKGKSIRFRADCGILKLRINLLAVIGAAIGLISVGLNWLTKNEVSTMWAKAGANQPFPSDVVPSLNLLGLCDGGWIFSQDLGFAVAAFLFFGGTILAFYTSLGGIAQIAGLVTYHLTFDAAHAAVVSGLPSGAGPKLGLISALLVMTSLIFPVFVWSKVKLSGIWRRFLTVAPEKSVAQEIPLIYAAAGSVVVLWGMVVWTRSRYEDATLSAVLFIVAGLILLVIGMLALILPWKSK